MRTSRTCILLCSLLGLGCALPDAGPPQGDEQGPKIDATAVVRRLTEGDLDEKMAAIGDASRAGPTIVGKLVPLLTHEGDPLVRAAAMRAITQLARGTSTEPRRSVEVTTAILDAMAATPGIDKSQRNQLVRLTGMTAQTDATIARLAALLDDRDVAEAAIFALERTPHASADDALLARLDRPSAVSSKKLIRTLGARRSTQATQRLIALSDNGELRHAALAALARIGDPKAESFLASNARDEIGTRAWLTYLDTRSTHDQGTTALRPLYVSLLSHKTPGARLAGLAGLRRLGGPEVFPHLLRALGDSDAQVRGTARGALTSSTAADIGVELVAAHDTVDDRTKREILGILTARKDARALPLIKSATASALTATATNAFALLGNFDGADVRELLVSAVTDTKRAEIRSAATASLNAFARRAIDRGDSSDALTLLHKILATDAPVGELKTALASVARVASPESLAIVEGFTGRRELSAPVTNARLSIARKLDRTKAVPLLNSILEKTNNRSTRRSALEALQHHGVDVSRFAAEKGFLASWHVIGPFAKSEKDGFGTHPFGTTPIDLTKDHEGVRGRVRWTEKRSIDPEARFNLKYMRPNSNCTAYAACTVEWPTDGDVTLKLGSDDGVAVWVNGDKVHENFASRGVRVDQDVVKTKFRAGANTILLKISQGGGDFGFCVRVADVGGRPVNLAK